MMAEMDILRTIIVSAYQAARQRGDSENVAFDRAFSIYRERNPDRPLDEARAEVSKMIFDPAGARDARAATAALDNRAERVERAERQPTVNLAGEIAALRRRIDDVERAQAGVSGERVDAIEAKIQQVDTRVGGVERRTERIEAAVAHFERLGQETRGQLADISAQIAALAKSFPAPPPLGAAAHEGYARVEPEREAPRREAPKREAPEPETDEREPHEREYGPRERAAPWDDEPPWLRNPLLFAWPWVWWFRMFRW
jgi:hypothetical protein